LAALTATAALTALAAFGRLYELCSFLFAGPLRKAASSFASLYGRQLAREQWMAIPAGGYKEMSSFLADQ
jgi:hypothetical protein